MVILVGVALGVALLYFWLVGHWFARVLMALVLTIPLGWIGASILGSAVQLPTDTTAPAVVGLILGVIAAWPIASIPVWIRRYPTAANRHLA
jgi:hypothetical protein